METDKSTLFKADGLLLLAAVIWGSAFVAQRMGMAHMGPLTFNGIRFALGTLVLLPWALRAAPGKPAGVDGALGRSPAFWGGALAGGVLFIAASLQQVGLIFTTAGKAGFITGLYVIIVPLLGLAWGHRPRWGGWIGACLATAGLYLLSVTGNLDFAPGDLWELAGALFWAVHVLVLSRLSPRMNPLRLACAQYAVCASLSLAAGAVCEPFSWEGTLGAALPLLYGGLLSVGVAYTLQVVAQRHAPPVHAAIILSLEAVFAALTGWIVLGEVLSARGFAGCALMLAGMIIAHLRS